MQELSRTSVRDLVQNYEMLWKLRVEGEKMYLDMGKMSGLLGNVINNSSSYNDKKAAVDDMLATLNTYKFKYDTSKIQTPEKYKYLQKAVVECPVNVELQNANGTQICLLRDGEETDITNEYGRFVSKYRATTGDYVKIAYLYSDEPYHIKTVGQTNGMVSYSLIRTTDHKESTVIGFNDIPIEKDSVILMETDKDTYAIDQDGDGTTDIEAKVADKSKAFVQFDYQNEKCIDVVYADEQGRIELPTPPTREGYKFVGWYTAPNGEGEEFTGQTKITKSITVYAKWDKVAPGDEPGEDEPGQDDNPEGVLPEDIPTDGIPEGLWIAGIDGNGYLYTGKVIKPEVRVYDNDRRLTAGKDYTITYKNNTKANDASKVKTAPSVVVKGKANYAGTETATFKILPVDLGSVEVFAEDIVVANNGKVQKKVPVLTFNGKKLANKKDFTVSYPSAGQEAYKAAGTYDVLLTAKANGNFTGTRVVKLTVTDSTLISKTSVKKLANQPYTGEAIMPKPKVTYKGKPLSEGTDYTLAYENNTEIGTATVILTGIGAYAGTKKITFKITGPSLKGAKVTVADTVYDGSAQTPKPQIELNGAILREGEDYTVAYQNNIKAGKATITISGIKSYSGTLKKTFQITAYDLGQDTDKALTGWDDILTAKYTKGGTKPKLQLQFKGTTLIAGEDYAVSYSNNKAITSAKTKKQPTVTIKGKGNFKGSLTKTFVITQKDLDDAEQPVRMMVADVAFKDKAGNYISKPVLTDTDGKALVAGTDYEKKIMYELSDKTPLNEKSKVDIGTVITVTVTGKGAYTGTRTATYCITKSDFSKAKISISPQIYTGKPIVLGEKDITVKIGNNPPLTYGKDYEIVADSYTNNVKKGTASVTVIGKGNYGGMKQVKFKITAKKFSWFWRIFG